MWKLFRFKSSRGKLETLSRPKPQLLLNSE
jgi:hypothetical protein